MCSSGSHHTNCRKGNSLCAQTAFGICTRHFIWFYKCTAPVNCYCKWCRCRWHVQPKWLEIKCHKILLIFKVTTIFVARVPSSSIYEYATSHVGVSASHTKIHFFFIDNEQRFYRPLMKLMLSSKMCCNLFLITKLVFRKNINLFFSISQVCSHMDNLHP